jgi:hypothetical protein
MSIKGAMAGLLAAFLLTMASWSSACDLSCSLASHHLGCAMAPAASAQKSAGSAASDAMDMKDCQHSGDAASASVEPSATNDFDALALRPSPPLLACTILAGSLPCPRPRSGLRHKPEQTRRARWRSQTLNQLFRALSLGC